MGYEIIRDGEKACFYDTVTMTAFGNVIPDDEIDEFGEWLDADPRTVRDLEEKYGKFLDEKEKRVRG